MKSAPLLLSLLASIAVSQPHKQAHQHRHAQQHKREDGKVVKWVTEYAYETEIVPVTETIWVSEGFVPPTTSSLSASSSKGTVAAQFFQPASKAKSSSSSPPPSSSSLYVVPAPVSTSVAPTSASAAPKAAESKAPEPQTFTSTPAPSPTPVKAPESKPASVYMPPVQTTAYSAPAPVTSSAPTSGSGSGSGSSSSVCSKGSPCEGDITHYDANAGTGACGWNSDGTTENVMALPHELMGLQSNGNPYCGRHATITLNGKSATAKIVDKCMGCTGYSIDLSDHAFQELEEMGVGRTQASWYFSD